MNEIKRVFVFGIDGMGNSPQMIEMPGFNRISSRGLYTNSGKTEYPPKSGAVWGTILHGVLPEEHQITNDSAKYHLWPTDSQYPSIFRMIRDQKPGANIGSICKWPQINRGMIEHNIKVNFHTGFDWYVSLCDKLYLEKSDVDFLFTVFDNVDHAGHKYGYFTDDFFEQAKKTDQQVFELIEIIDRKGWLNESLILIVTDHGGGGGDPKDHGIDHPKDMTVSFALCGPGIPHAEIPNFRNCDIPSIIISAFGIEKPSNWQGRTLNEIVQQCQQNSQQNNEN